jgi:hypothetical protein
MSCGGRKLELDCHMEEILVKFENLEKFEYKMFTIEQKMSNNFIPKMTGQDKT